MYRIINLFFALLITVTFVHCPLAKIGKFFSGADDATKAIKHTDSITDTSKVGKAGTVSSGVDEAASASKKTDDATDIAGDTAGVGADIYLETSDDDEDE